MKIVLESSSLFFKEYTGIPFYILNLYHAMAALEEIEPLLGFNIKKIIHRKNLRDDVKDRSHCWYYRGKMLDGTSNISVAHSLHTPFLNLKRTKKVATIHDLAVHLKKFETYEFANEYFKKKRFGLFEQFARHTDALIAVSESTKQDFLKFFNYPEENIHVVPLAPSMHRTTVSTIQEEKILQNLNLIPKKFLLSVGGVSLRKNSMNLLKAYRRSLLYGEYTLVFAGKISDSLKLEVYDYLEKYNLKNYVRITGYVDDESLDVLYRNAKAFMFPTFYEGFGIPILEAMNYGLPVLTGNIGASPETGGGHVILTDPFDPESIAAGINTLEDISTENIEHAKRFAQNFTWQETARMTIDVYRKLM